MLRKLRSPNRLGTNTMQWHSVPADRAMATWRVPMTDASFGLPGTFQRSWQMLTTTTTALYTSMNTASSWPLIVRLLRVQPAYDMQPSVIPQPTGIAIGRAHGG